MFDRILVPTDGSDEAEAAAERAFDLAVSHDAAIHVISVSDAGPLSEIRLPGDEASAEDAIHSQAEEFASQLADRARERGLEVTTAVRSGPPGDEILEYAGDADVDLIVMGTRGRGGVHRMALGSVSDHVIRFGDVDVLIAGDTGAP